MPNEEIIAGQGFRPITEFLLNQIGGQTGVILLYFSILIFAALTYKLGFARKLPLLKSIIVYILLALGCFILLFFAILLPMLEVLVICSLVLGIYRYRLAQERKRRNGEGVENQT
ncbi:YlaH-like protein [Salinibacillus kushneri]|uniref:YlaH-like protein n=1 Tax=Salinibacillus kushneri TaxID=237682 RepID=A0A1I0HTF3_9BACI|nr:YlaH-like family protein [Salinibacillus kushneri]SET86520.1 YlaH-like protein [Salinibacillus kushneri]